MRCSPHARAVAALILIALLAFLPGFFQIPPTDRDEARFAQATKQRPLQRRQYVEFRSRTRSATRSRSAFIGCRSAWSKPRKRSASATRHQDLAHRIPSLAGAIGAVLLTYWAALAFVAQRCWPLARYLQFDSARVEARLAKTDAMLLLTCVATMGAMARAYLVVLRRRRPGPAHGHCPRSSGPRSPRHPAERAADPAVRRVGDRSPAIIDRSVRWLGALKPVPGLIWLCILVLPVPRHHEPGRQHVPRRVGRPRSARQDHQRAGGARWLPGYYFVLFWLTFWPGATLAAMAVPGIWAARREKGANFCSPHPRRLDPLELVITKLPHYVLPLYPAIAILIAGVVDTSVLARQRWLTRGAGTWFFMPMLLGIGMVIVLVVFGGSSDCSPGRSSSRR